MSKLRILHLSDLHLAENRAVYERIRNHTDNLLSVCDPDALEVVAQIVHEWSNKLDAILISGDIVVAGTDRNLNRSIDFFETPPALEEPWLNSKRKPTLKAFTKPIIIVPGNHDRFSNILGWPGKLFYNYYSSYWTVGIGGIQSHFLPDKRSPTLAIICGDFSLDNISDCSSLGGHWGQGKIYENRLQKLIQETKMVVTSYPACAIMWMIHFAPKYEDHFRLEVQMQLLNSEDLIEEAEKFGVGYILCGHTHLHRDYLIGKDQKIRIHCAGTSTCVDLGYDTTIHLLDIEIENGRIVNFNPKSLAYDPDQQTFFWSMESEGQDRIKVKGKYLW